MSAFILPAEHIHVLLWGALRAGHGRVCWHYGNPTRMGELTDTTASTVGQMLLDANVASVNYLYNATDTAEAYRYQRPVHTDWSAVELLKALACYEYQSCEAPDWEGSSAQRLCRVIERELIVTLRGWQEAPWSLSTTTASTAAQRRYRSSRRAEALR
ncbi:MAG: hypothetical protein KIH64_011090 [Mycobacterium sp.]|jgi:hypothetical protein|nr:hypothetical protein [Mycobacterium sp.]